MRAPLGLSIDAGNDGALIFEEIVMVDKALIGDNIVAEVLHDDAASQGLVADRCGDPEHLPSYVLYVLSRRKPFKLEELFDQDKPNHLSESIK